MNNDHPGPPRWLQRIRAWLRSDMLVLRWVLLVLYVVVVNGLFLSAMSGSGDDLLVIFGFAALTFGCQILFLLGGGTMHLSRPIRRRRLWMPVGVAALMFGVLAGGLFLALSELFYLDEKLDDSLPLLFWSFVAANWVVWFLLFFAAARNRRRMKVLGRLVGALIAGSLAELLVASASHMVVSRRPGCLVGLMTMFGILAGLYVMLFTFGPGIVLLFLRPRHRREQAEGSEEQQRPWYQFSLRTAFLIMLVVSIASAWLGVALEPVRKNRQAAAEVYATQARIEHLGGSVGLSYDRDPDPLDKLLGNPGVFRIAYVEGGPDFDDAGLEALRGLHHIEHLKLAGTQVTDAGLQHLATIGVLWSLDLTGTQVTDAGLLHLRDRLGLIQVYLTDTQVTAEGVKQLREALPDCTIEHESIQ